MKKFHSVVLVSLLLSVILVLAGCSNNGGSNDADGVENASSTAPTATSGETSTEKSNEKVTLTVLVRGNALVEDFATNDYTKWLEDQSNVHIEWSVADPSDYRTKLNLVLASGDLPDIIMNMAISPAQQLVYGEQGLFVPLNDAIDEYGTNIKKIFAEMPEVKNAITAPENKIYSLPSVNECVHCSMNYKMFVYKPWLEKLGLQEPTSTEEFYQMLLAFKHQDPNGNSQADEIPLVGAGLNTYRSKIDVFLMNSFIYNDGDKRMILNDGKIDVVYNKPEWREGLKYIHKLYAEGLIAPQTFTQDDASLKKITSNPDIAIAGAAPAHSPSSITAVGAEDNRWLEYQPIAPLKGPDGFQKAVYLPFSKVGTGNFVVTSANKNLEATIRWADTQYMFEATLRNNFGNEGVGWSKPEPGDTGRFGAPALYRLLKPPTSSGQGAQNEGWNQSGISFRTDKDYYAGQVVLEGQPNYESMYYKYTETYYEPYKQDFDKIVPPLYFFEENAAELADLDKTINEYVETMTATFINGESDIDKDWDNYIDTLNKMNLKRYLEIYQQAYDSSSHSK